MIPQRPLADQRQSQVPAEAAAPQGLGPGPGRGPRQFAHLQAQEVKFTTFTTLPSEELAYDSVPAGEGDEEDEEDLGWGCPRM